MTIFFIESSFVNVISQKFILITSMVKCDIHFDVHVYVNDGFLDGNGNSNAVHINLILKILGSHHKCW